MAQATVTLKVTPKEFDMVVSALKMYSHVVKRLGNSAYEHPLEGFRVDLLDDDTHATVLMANKIITDIRK